MGAYLAVSLIGGALTLEHRSSLRLMLSQPVCSGLILGLALGSPAEGLFAGLMFQVMFLGYVHLRGERIPDIPVGGLASSAIYILSIQRLGGASGGSVLFLSLLLGLLVSLGGYGLYLVWERRAWDVSALAMRYIMEGRYRLAARLHMTGLLFHFILGFVILIAVVPAGVGLVTLVAGRSGMGWGGAVDAIRHIVPFIGAGLLARLYFVRERAFWFGAGFLVTYVLFLIKG
jgi:mannose/fructose/N-acetylgalactosamine-specific phosphotransferase system component IIC